MTGPVGLLPVVLVLLLAALPGARSDPLRGERVFQRCYACHSVVAGEDNLPGPNLRGVLGRRAGTLPGFEFSPAMIEAGTARGLVWTRGTLDAFLADPQGMVPGTAMGTPGLPDPGDRRDVIDYLEQASSRILRGDRPPTHGLGWCPPRGRPSAPQDRLVFSPARPPRLSKLLLDWSQPPRGTSGRRWKLGDPGHA